MKNTQTYNTIKFLIFILLLTANIALGKELKTHIHLSPSISIREPSVKKALIAKDINKTIMLTQSGKDFFSKLRQFNIRSGKVLGLASGKGTDEIYITEQGYNVTITDKKEADLIEAKNIAAKRSLDITTETIVLNEPLPYETASFNAIYIRLGLHYFSINKLLQIIPELERVLTPGGVIYIVIKSTDDFYYKKFGTSDRTREDGMILVEDPQTKETYYRSFFSKNAIEQLFKNFQIDEIKSHKERLYDDNHDSSLLTLVARKKYKNSIEIPDQNTQQVVDKQEIDNKVFVQINQAI